MQADFDVVWCRGTVGEKIFKPWLQRLEEQGCKFVSQTRVTDVVLDEASGAVTGVACGEHVYPADSVVLAVGINGIQQIVANR